MKHFNIRTFNDAMENTIINYNKTSLYKIRLTYSLPPCCSGMSNYTGCWCKRFLNPIILTSTIKFIENIELAEKIGNVYAREMINSCSTSVGVINISGIHRAEIFQDIPIRRWINLVSDVKIDESNDTFQIGGEYRCYIYIPSVEWIKKETRGIDKDLANIENWQV